MDNNIGDALRAAVTWAVNDKGLYDSLAEFEQYAKQHGITVTLKPEMQAGALKGQIEQMTREFADLRKESERNSRAFEEMESAAESALNSLATKVPAAVKALREAATQGPGAVREALSRMERDATRVRQVGQQGDASKRGRDAALAKSLASARARLGVVIDASVDSKKLRDALDTIKDATAAIESVTPKLQAAEERGNAKRAEEYGARLSKAEHARTKAQTALRNLLNNDVKAAKAVESAYLKTGELPTGDSSADVLRITNELASRRAGYMDRIERLKQKAGKTGQFKDVVTGAMRRVTDRVAEIDALLDAANSADPSILGVRASALQRKADAGRPVARQGHFDPSIRQAGQALLGTFQAGGDQQGTQTRLAQLAANIMHAARQFDRVSGAQVQHEAAAGGGSVGPLRLDVDTQKVIAEIRESFAKTPLEIKLDTKDLHAQVKAVLDGELTGVQALLKLGIDREFFVAALREEVAHINTLGFRLQMGVTGHDAGGQTADRTAAIVAKDVATAAVEGALKAAGIVARVPDPQRSAKSDAVNRTIMLDALQDAANQLPHAAAISDRVASSKETVDALLSQSRQRQTESERAATAFTASLREGAAATERTATAEARASDALADTARVIAEFRDDLLKTESALEGLAANKARVDALLGSRVNPDNAEAQRAFQQAIRDGRAAGSRAEAAEADAAEKLSDLGKAADGVREELDDLERLLAAAEARRGNVDALVNASSNRLAGSRVDASDWRGVMTVAMRERREAAVRAAAREKWEQTVDQLFSNFAQFDADRPNLLANRKRDRDEESRKQYLTYLKAVEKYENSILALRHAETDEAREDALARVKALQEVMRLEEDRVRYRVLFGKQDVQMRDTRIEYGRRNPDDATDYERPLSATFGARRNYTPSEALFLSRNALRAQLGPEFESHNQARSGGTGLEVVSLDKYLKGLFATEAKLNDIQKEFLTLRKLAQDANLPETERRKILDAELKDLRDILAVYEKVNDEAQSAIAPMELRRRRAAAGGGEFTLRGLTSGYKNTIRDAAAMFGGFAVGYTAVSGIRNQMREYMAFEQELAGIQGVLRGMDQQTRDMLGGGIGQIAAKYGSNLLETAKAARVLAQSGLEATEVIQALDTTMAAAKGMGMTIEQVQELQVAIRAVTQENEKFVTGVDYATAVLNKISQVEARYAVEGQDLAQSIKIMAPIIDGFATNVTGLGDSFDYVNAMTTVMVERLRITGTQAANAMKIIFSRLTNPQILKQLQGRFKLQLADENTGDFLPVDQMIETLGRKYQSLGGVDQKRLATVLSGGRNVPQVMALLQNYARVQQIATESAFAFNGAQERSSIAMDTLATAAERVRTNMSLFTKSMLENSGAAYGMKSALNGLANLLGGANGQGGGTGTFLSLILGGGAAYQAGKGLFALLSGLSKTRLDGVTKLGGLAATMGRLGKSFGTLVGMFRTGTFLSRLVGLGSILTRILSPAAIMLTILTGAIALYGKYAKSADAARVAQERYGASVKDMKDIDVTKLPQVQEFDNRAQRFGIASGDGKTIADRYNAVMDATRQARAKLSQESAKTLAEYEKLNDNQKSTFREKNKAAFEAFQAEFVPLFIEQFGGETKELFAGLTTTGERLSEVTKLVGGAAFTAATQVRSAISEISRATHAMMEDTVADLERIRKEGDGLGWWARNMNPTLNSPLRVRQVGADLGAFANDPQYRYDKRVQARERFLNDLGESLADVKGGAGGIFKSPLFRQEAGRILNDETLDQIITGKIKLTYNDLLNMTMNALATEANKNLAAGIVIASTGRAADLAKLDSATANNPLLGLTQQQKSARQIGGAFGVIQAAADSILQAKNRNATPASASGARGVYDALTGTAAGGLPGLVPGVTDSAGKANRSLVEFKDTLLDFAITVRNQVRKIASDARFAQAYGLGYNRPAAALDLARNLNSQLDNFDDDRTAEILKLLRERASLRSVPSRDENGAIPPEVVRRSKIDERLSELRGDALRFGTETLPKVLGDKKAAADFAKEWSDAFGQALSPDTFEKMFRKAISTLATEARSRQDFEARTSQQFEFQRTEAERLNELSEADLSLAAESSQRMELKLSLAEKLYRVQLASLEAQMASEGADKDAIGREIDNLTRVFTLNQAIDKGLLLRQRAREVEAQKVADTTLMYEMQRESIERSGELLEAQLPVTARMADSYQVRQAVAEAIYQSTRSELLAKRTLKDVNQNDLERDIKRLDAQHERNRLVEAELQVAQARRALEQQSLDNLNGMLSGFKNLFLNTDLWEQVYNPEGDTIEERHKKKAEAIRNIIYSTISPVFKTIYDRIVENTFGAITESLMKNSAIRDLLAGPESLLRDDYGKAISTASLSGSQMYYDAIVRASQVASGQTPTGSPSSSASSVPGANVSRRGQIIGGIGMLVGTTGGTMLGGGGPLAQMGSSLGSMGGALLGAKYGSFLGPYGTAIGAVVGGLAGGLLGKLDHKEKPTQQDPVVKGLEAIEAAQRETVQTIQAQTDSLLKLDSRFLNLPSGFNAPSYRPGLASSGGSGVFAPTNNVELTVNVNGGNPKDVERAVRDALGDLLYDDRRNRPR